MVVSAFDNDTDEVACQTDITGPIQPIDCNPPELLDEMGLKVEYQPLESQNTQRTFHRQINIRINDQEEAKAAKVKKQKSKDKRQTKKKNEFTDEFGNKIEQKSHSIQPKGGKLFKASDRKTTIITQQFSNAIVDIVNKAKSTI